MFKKLSHLIVSHKILSIIIAIVIVGGGYFWYSSSKSGVAVTKYIVESDDRNGRGIGFRQRSDAGADHD